MSACQHTRIKKFESGGRICLDCGAHNAGMSGTLPSVPSKPVRREPTFSPEVEYYRWTGFLQLYHGIHQPESNGESE